MKNKNSYFMASYFASSLFALLVQTFAFSESIAQTTSNPDKVVPASPNVAALGKYGDIPVSPYTGLADISLPIYTIISKDITIPISISYHASGIKVGEEASRVGLGWALNAGGVISKTVMGEDDFSTVLASKYRYFNTLDLPKGNVNGPVSRIQPGCNVSFLNTDIKLPVEYGWKDENYDLQPDHYSYNFISNSGKFILDRNKQAVLAKEEKIEFTCASDGSSWTVKTADGMHYTFDVFEIYRDEELGVEHKSAWYLTKITSPTNEEVTFHYDITSVDYIRPVGNYSETRYDLNLAMPGPLSGCTTGEMPANQAQPVPGKSFNKVFLSHIDFRQGSVKFSYGTRVDLEGDKQLDAIEVFRKLSNGNLEASPLKTFSFIYDYFIGSHDSGYTTTNATTDQLSKRLKLLSLTEKTTVNGQLVSKNPFEFSYYEPGSEGSRPKKTSFARDHWGYFNNKTGNTSLIPTPKYVTLPSAQHSEDEMINAVVGTIKDERDTDPNHIKLFSLKEIKYPTQGRTEFEYEAHEYDIALSKEHDNSYFGMRQPVIYEETKSFTYSGSERGSEVTVGTLDLTNLYRDASGNYPLTHLSAHFRLSNACQYSNNSSMYFLLEGPSSTTVYWHQATCTSQAFTYTHDYPLSPGIYTFKVYIISESQDPQINGFQEIKATYTFSANLLPGHGQSYGYAGGLRVSRITDHDGINETNNKVKRFLYNYTADKNEDGIEEEYSYGKLMSMPQYSYIEGRTGSNPCFYQVLVVRSSESSIPLNGSAGGSVVGYSQVTILNGENGEFGKTVYTYENEPDLVLNYDLLLKLTQAGDGTDATGVRAPARPPSISTIPYEKNGLLIKQREFARKGNDFFPVKEVVTDYFSTPNQTTISYGIEKRLAGINGVACNTLVFFYPAMQSNWIHPKFSIEKHYDQQDTTKFISINTTHTYETTPVHYQVKSKQQTTSSSAETILTEYTYPADYTSVNTGSIGLMKGAKYHHAAVIESVTKQVDNVASKVVRASFTNYEISGTDNPATTTIDERKVLPASVAALEIASPQSSFTSSLATGTAADASYRLKQTMGYNVITGNLAEVQTSNNIPTTYLWGYNHMYPVAEIKGASYSEVKLALGLQPTAEVDLGAEGLSQTQINTLKASLSHVLITTFTYDPLKGMTSQTDPAGVTTYFDYDELSRLKLIKDQNQNIRKQFIYHYKSSN